MNNPKEVYVLDIVDDFTCMGGDCPYTCCKGWQVCIDEDTLKLYRAQKGVKGLALYSMCKNNSGTTVLRKICGRCPFYTLKGLCGLQLKGEEQMMPLVCRMYPRCSFAYGDRQEVTLEMSCIKAAELLVNNPKRYSFVKSDREYPLEWQADDADPAFVDFLTTMREKMLDYLWDEERSMAAGIRGILDYAHKVHLLVAQNKLEEAAKADFSESVSGEGFIFFPMVLMNEHIYGVLEDSRIMFREPYLYKILKNYKKQFGKLWEYEADEYFGREIEKLFRACPEAERIAGAYFGYTIMQSMLASGEDYYFIKHVVMAAVLVQYFIIFVLTDFKCGEMLDNDRYAAIISNMEKGIAHNYFIVDTMVKSINAIFFK